MIERILQIADDVQAQRERIDRAANDVAVTTPRFRQYEQAIISLNAAIASLKAAALLIQDSQAATIVWMLDETDDKKAR